MTSVLNKIQPQTWKHVRLQEMSNKIHAAYKPAIIGSPLQKPNRYTASTDSVRKAGRFELDDFSTKKFTIGYITSLSRQSIDRSGPELH